MKTRIRAARLVSALFVLALVSGVPASAGRVHANPALHPVVVIKACDWDVENVFVIPGKVGGKERKALDALLDALVKAVGAAGPQVAAVKKAIDALGPGGDIVDVVVVYVCTDNTGKVTRKKIDLDPLTETLYWAAKMNLVTGGDAKQRDRDRQKAIDTHRPKVSCCPPVKP